MTRFERELNGELGAFWKKDAENRIRKIEEQQINGEIFFGADGVVRWTSNNRVMPSDCREVLAHSVYRDLFNEEASRKAEKEETRRSLEAYAKAMANHKPSEEERYEMEAAFGKGAKVTNILTGTTYSL